MAVLPGVTVSSLFMTVPARVGGRNTMNYFGSIEDMRRGIPNTAREEKVERRK